MDTIHDGSGNSVRILRALLVVAVIVVLATIACSRYPDLRTHPVHGITQVAKRLAGQHAEQINTRSTTSRYDPHIADLLGQVRVVDTVPTIAGYQRSCATNSACVFGPAWTDDTTADLSRNGCDTRIIYSPRPGLARFALVTVPASRHAVQPTEGGTIGTSLRVMR